MDTNGEPIEIARGVYREWNCEPSKLNDYVERLREAYNGSAEILSVKLYLMRLIHLLARGFTYSSKDYNMIKPALEYIKKHFTENSNKFVKIAILYSENKIFAVDQSKEKNLHNRYEGEFHSIYELQDFI